MSHSNSPLRSRGSTQRLYNLLGLATLAFVATGTVVFRVLEEWSWVDSLYFSVIAVTTVGFGDLAPTTDATKLFTVFYVVAGVSIVATYLNVRLRAHHEKLAQLMG